MTSWSARSRDFRRNRLAPCFAKARRRMVERDLRGRDIKDRRVLEVMGRVPRHRFVPKERLLAKIMPHLS